MHENHDKLDRALDEALDMTFPASDPLASAAPGSTSRHANGRNDVDSHRGRPSGRRAAARQDGSPKHRDD